MGDLRYAVLLTATVLGGYFNRDELFEEFLDRYNDEFPAESEVQTNFQTTFDFITECGFDKKSRIWRKADLFTALIEFYVLLCQGKIELQPSEVIEALGRFYSEVDNGSLDQTTVPGIYYKAALQASNDRVNRVRRGIILNEVVRGTPGPVVLNKLRQQGLV